MDNYNIRRDRPKLSSDEIAQHRDFDSVLNDYRILKKPFYKNLWFFGVTGMASVGLLVGATFSFTDRPAEPPLSAVTTEAEPIRTEGKTIYLASMETSVNEVSVKKPKAMNLKTQKKKQTYDNTSTLINASEPTEEVPEKLSEEVKVKTHSVTEKSETSNSLALQNHPKINGKIGGNLSVQELSQNTVIFTDSKIPISGFEMHLATEFGAKVYKSNSDQLTTEMIDAMKSADINSEVYFEGITGQLTKDFAKNLQPIKFTLIK